MKMDRKIVAKCLAMCQHFCVRVISADCVTWSGLVLFYDKTALRPTKPRLGLHTVSHGTGLVTLQHWV